MSKAYYFTVTFEESIELLLLLAKTSQGKGLEIFRFFLPDINSGLGTYSGSHVMICAQQVENRPMVSRAQLALQKEYGNWINDKGYTQHEDLPDGFSLSSRLTVEQFLLHILFLDGGLSNNQVQDQVLLVTPYKDQAELRSMIQALATTATGTRVAVKEMSTGTSLAFFWIKDDETRGSTFQSLLAGQYFSSAAILKEYTNGEHSIFLRDNLTWGGYPRRPGNQGIRWVAEFLNYIYAITPKTQNQPANHKLVAAVIQDPTDGSVQDNLQLLDLRSLVFINQAALVYRTNEFSKVEIVTGLNNPDHFNEKLRESIMNSDLAAGYPLYLNDTGLELKYTELPDLASYQQQIDSLAKEMNRIEYRIALLQSVGDEKPLLMRFTQAQLPALVDYLVTLSPKRLADGNLLYAYQATNKVHEGYHYLFIRPELLSEADISPLFAWPNLQDKRVFWLDPTWARYYPDSIGNCYVFVPHQMSISPSMHSWEDNEMDTYLKTTMSNWARQENNTTVEAEIPIYVFDSTKNNSVSNYLHGDLQIYVLDLKNFSNLSVNLPWINDNLTMHRELTTRDFIRAMAESKTRENLYQQQLGKENKLRAMLDESELKIQSQLTAILDNLAKAITEQLNTLNKTVVDSASKARVLNQALNAIDAEFNSLSNMISETSRMKATYNAEVDAKLKEIQALHEKIDQVVEKSNQTVLDIKTKTGLIINQLESEETKQKDRLANIRIAVKIPGRQR